MYHLILFLLLICGRSPLAMAEDVSTTYEVSNPVRQETTPTSIRIGIAQSNGILFGLQSAGFAQSALNGYAFYEDQRATPFEVGGNLYRVELEIKTYDDLFDPTTGIFDGSDMLRATQEFYDDGIRIFIGSLYAVLYANQLSNYLEALPEKPLFINPNSGYISLASDKDYFFSGSPTPTNAAQAVLDSLAISGAKSISMVYTNEDAGLFASCNAAISQANDRGINTIGFHQLTTNPALDGSSIPTYNALVDLLAQIQRDEQPDILYGCFYALTQNITMRVLKQMNWMPSAVMFSTTFIPQDLYSIEDAEFVIMIDSWNENLKYPGDDIFGTPIEFSNKYTAFLGNGLAPNSIDAMAVHMPFTVELAYKSAVEHFRITDGSLPSIEEVIFSYARLDNSTFYSNLKYNVEGAFDALYPAIQLFGSFADRNYTEPYFSRQVIAPISARTGNVVYPAPTFDERTEDLGWYKNVEEIIFATLTSIAIVISFIFMVFVIYNWPTKKNLNDPARHSIRYATPEFLIIMLIGSIFMYSSLYTWQLYETAVACALIPWQLGLGYCMFIGALSVKTYRIYVIFTNMDAFQVTKMKFIHICLILIALLLVPIILLIVWTIIDPVKAVKVVPDIYRPSQNYVECQINDIPGQIMVIILITYCGLISVSAILGCFLVRRVKIIVFNESNRIIMAIAILIIASVVLLGIIAGGTSDRNDEYIIRSILILLVVFSLVLLIFAPIAYYSLRRIGKDHHSQIPSNMIGHGMSFTSEMTKGCSMNKNAENPTVVSIQS